MICAVYKSYPNTMASISRWKKFCRFFDTKNKQCLIPIPHIEATEVRIMKFNHEYGDYSYYFYDVKPCKAKKLGLNKLSIFRNVKHLDEFLC